MHKIKKEHYFELRCFCIDYHSGQWSRGYRIQCKIGRSIKSKMAPKNWTSALMQELRDTDIYRYLVDNYADTI